jgi:ribosome-binding protein aMBF1 (putative translation factor)
MKSTVKNLGAAIRENRQRVGISQVALAKKCKTGQFTISKVENGRTPTLGLLERIARAFGCGVMICFEEIRTAKKGAPRESTLKGK